MGKLRRLFCWTLAALLLPSLAGSRVPTAPVPTDPATTPAVRLFDLGAVEAETAALLLSGQSGGNLPGAVMWCGAHELDHEGRVPAHLVVELDGLALLDGAGSDRVPVTIAAYALDERGVVVANLTRGILIEGDGVRAALEPRGLRFVGELSVPPGLVSLRTSIRVYGSDRILLDREELRIEPAAAGRAAVSPPFFAAPDRLWLEARHQGSVQSAGCGHGETAAAKPVLDVTRPTTFSAVASGWPENARLLASVVDRHGHMLEQPRLAIVATRPAGETGARVLEIEMEPFDVPPGDYRLTLHVVTDSFEEVAVRGLDARLIHGGAASSAPGFGQQPIPSPASADAGERPRKRQIRSIYTDALRMLAEGEETDARRTVSELERRVFAGDPASGPTTLRTAELKVATRLERVDPGSLLPLIVLHRNLFRTYTAYREGALAHHSAMVVSELAEMIGTIQGGPQIEDIAETALISVALDLVRGLDRLVGGHLLERTLELDPESIPALINLAFLRELEGRPNDAVTLLEELVLVDPENSEAWLRLGVNLRRTGHSGAAQNALRPLLEHPTPEWIRSVAAQELAHIMVEQGGLDRAEHLLSRTIDDIANHQTLAIQLSWTRELAGKSAEATATLKQIESDGGRRRDSARMRYCRWPEMGAYDFAIAFDRAAERGRPDLERALAPKGSTP